MADFPAGRRGPSGPGETSETVGVVLAVLIIIGLIGWILYGLGVTISGVWRHDVWQVLTGIFQIIGALLVFKLLSFLGKIFA